MLDETQIRLQICQMGRWLWEKNYLAGNDGNISVRMGDDRILGIKLPHKLWNAIRTEVGCTDLWARDLRRTFATVGLNSGVGIDLIGLSLNHTEADTTRIYARLHDQNRINTVTTIAERIEQITGKVS